MNNLWRSFRRWYINNRTRAGELGLLLLACGLVACWLFVLDAPGAGHFVPAAARPDARLGLMLGFALLGLAVFSWRRWREIDALLEEAETDVLTGLNNRRMIESVLAREFDRAMRYGRPLSIIMLDIDHFKQVNDTHGHATGDLVLQAIARRLTRRMRVSDHVGRWGGEEFIMICPETDTPDAMLVADRLRRSIKQKPVRKAGTITASLGVSTYTGQGDYEALIAESDHYLYAAKQQGRDRVISKFTLMAQNQLKKEGWSFESVEQPGLVEAHQTDRLSTMMSTIAEPLRRVRQRAFGR